MAQPRDLTVFEDTAGFGVDCGLNFCIQTEPLKSIKQLFSLCQVKNSGLIKYKSLSLSINLLERKVEI